MITKLSMFAMFFIVFFMGTLNATVVSSNTGEIPSTCIQYVVTLEKNDGQKLHINFVFKNRSKKTIIMSRASIDIPGYMSVFFSTDKTGLIQNNKTWSSDAIPTVTRYRGFSMKEVKPDESLEVSFPLGVWYNKIYDKIKEANVYVYWGLTLNVLDDGSFPKEYERVTIGKVTAVSLPRIGGMLSIHKENIKGK